jgi:diguanylate cyclase (GGDEF)-like protein
MQEGKLQEREVYLHHKNGHRVPVLVRTSPLIDSDGKTIGGVEVFSDNSPKISLMQRVQSLEKMALLDPLTMLGNRRFAETQLASRLDEMRRYGWHFGVFFIDIDHFKNINDTYGHEIGDKVLQMTARTLQNGVRSFDTVCRWGGEEFVSIVAGVDERQLLSLAERLRVLVGQSSLPVGGSTIHITISIGVAVVRPDDTEQTVIARADNLMYRSKALGRNRVSHELSVVDIKAG